MNNITTTNEISAVGPRVTSLKVAKTGRTVITAVFTNGLIEKFTSGTTETSLDGREHRTFVVGDLRLLSQDLRAAIRWADKRGPTRETVSSLLEEDVQASARVRAKRWMHGGLVDDRKRTNVWTLNGTDWVSDGYSAVHRACVTHHTPWRRHVTDDRKVTKELPWAHDAGDPALPAWRARWWAPRGLTSPLYDVVVYQSTDGRSDEYLSVDALRCPDQTVHARNTYSPVILSPQWVVMPVSGGRHHPLLIPLSID